MFICNCCGQEVRGVSRETLGTIKFNAGQITELFDALYRVKDGATLEQLVWVLYGATGEHPPETAKDRVRDCLNRIRYRLKPYGWTVGRLFDGKIYALIGINDVPKVNRSRAARMAKLRSVK